MKEWGLGVILNVYDDLVSGRKKIETRAPEPDKPEKNYESMSLDDILAFHAVDDKFKKIDELPILKFSVSSIRKYPCIKTLLANEGIKNVLPNASSVEEAIKVYYSFPEYKERIEKYGLVAIGLRERIL